MKTYTKLIIILIIGVLLSACHSDYVHINYKLHHNAVYNEDSSQTAFIISKCAYRPAKGISRFPDGGIADFLMEETSLYLLDSNNQIEELIKFNDMSKLLGCFASSWKTNLAFVDSSIYVSVLPVSDWGLYLKNADNKKDSLFIKQLKDKYSNPFLLDPETKMINNVDTSLLFTIKETALKVDYMTLKHKIDKLPLNTIGIDIKKIDQKSDQDYIKETIYLKNKSAVTRRAVMEQIISKKSKKDIKNILDKMDTYKNSLDVDEKSAYIRRSKPIYEELKSML